MLLKGSIDHKRMKTHNLSQIVRAIWKDESITRVELSRRLGLSRSAITSFVQQLLAQGIIEEAHAQRSIGGRPAITLRINSRRFQLIGVDMGSSHLQVISLSLTGEVLRSAYTSFDCCGDPLGTVHKMEQMIEQCLVSDIQPLGIGVAVPCPVFKNNLDSRILPLWTDIDLKSHLQTMFSVPVCIDNDANLGALAEQWHSNNLNEESFVFIKIATGVGAGIVNDGSLLRGAKGYAGEIGHLVLFDNGQCRCGSVGCLEAQVGSLAVRRKAMGIADGRLAQGELPSIQMIKDSAKVEDALAMSVVQRSAEDLATAIGVLLNMYNPHRVVLWGELVDDNALFFKHLRQTVIASNHWSVIQSTNIVPSVIGEQGIAIGAGMLALEKALDDPSLFSTRTNHKETICTH